MAPKFAPLTQKQKAVMMVLTFEQREGARDEMKDAIVVYCVSPSSFIDPPLSEYKLHKNQLPLMLQGETNEQEP